MRANAPTIVNPLMRPDFARSRARSITADDSGEWNDPRNIELRRSSVGLSSSAGSNMFAGVSPQRDAAATLDAAPTESQPSARTVVPATPTQSWRAPPPSRPVSLPPLATPVQPLAALHAHPAQPKGPTSPRRTSGTATVLAATSVAPDPALPQAQAPAQPVLAAVQHDDDRARPAATAGALVSATSSSLSTEAANSSNMHDPQQQQQRSAASVLVDMPGDGDDGARPRSHWLSSAKLPSRSGVRCFFAVLVVAQVLAIALTGVAAGLVFSHRAAVDDAVALLRNVTGGPAVASKLESGAGLAATIAVVATAVAAIAVAVALYGLCRAPGAAGQCCGSLCKSGAGGSTSRKEGGGASTGDDDDDDENRDDGSATPDQADESPPQNPLRPNAIITRPVRGADSRRGSAVAIGPRRSSSIAQLRRRSASGRGAALQRSTSDSHSQPRTMTSWSQPGSAPTSPVGAGGSRARDIASSSSCGSALAALRGDTPLQKCEIVMFPEASLIIGIQLVQRPASAGLLGEISS